MADSYSEKQDAESVSDVDDFDTPEDRQLLRKIDIRLIPILTLLYLLSYLDRTNIGNAKVDGLTTDLHMSPPAYNTALATYTIAYMIFDIPSNIVFKRSDPQLWLPSLALLWGTVSIFQGLVTNQAGLFGVRFLLGVTEAGLFPGVIFLFSVYYRRRERGWRVAIFFGGAALAGAFGGILAYVIGKMEGVGGKRGWQWIFIIEGLITVAVALISYFLVPTWSYKAKFLTEAERARLLARLAADCDPADKEEFSWFFVRQALTDHLVWAYAFLFHGFAFVLYSLSLFLPTIIAGLGFQSWEAQLMSVPPNTLAALVLWACVWLSARYTIRAPIIIAAASVAIIGYIVVITASTAGAQYVGVHLAVAGIYAGNSLLLSWPSENVAGQTKRAIAVALQITIGGLGSTVGVLIYRPEYAGHRFRKPHIVAIGYLTLSIAAASYLWVCMARENGRRDQVLRRRKEEATQIADEKHVPELEASAEAGLGDRAIEYRYQL